MQSWRIQMPSREEIVSEARSWLGVKWRHQGRKRSGVDCCGLVIVVARDLGLTCYDTNRYSRRTTGDEFVHHFVDAGMTKIPMARAQPGDVILTADRLFPCHCGIIGSNEDGLTIIHAYANKRMVVEEPLRQWLPLANAMFSFGVD